MSTKAKVRPDLLRPMERRLPTAVSPFTKPMERDMARTMRSHPRRRGRGFGAVVLLALLAVAAVVAWMVWSGMTLDDARGRSLDLATPSLPTAPTLPDRPRLPEIEPPGVPTTPTPPAPIG